MEFNVNVEATKEIIFKPSRLILRVGHQFISESKDSFGKSVVSVMSSLIQELANGSIVENTHREFPSEILSAIDSLDENKRPAINTEALAEILAGFNLRLAPKVEAEVIEK